MKSNSSFKVLQVDAFTTVPFGGNPAAVVLDADNLSEETMSKIAKEMNVRETVFVSKSSKADYKFVFMTPEGPLGFSGHPTIAAFHALVDEGLVELVDDVTMFSLETTTGILQIEIVKNETTRFHEVQITHKKPEFLTTYDPLEIAEALGLSLGDIMAGLPVQTVSTGSPVLVVPLNSMKSLERINLNVSAITKLCKAGDYVSIQVFTKDVIEVTSDIHARHFAPALGVNEDPVSGIGAGAAASYIIRYGLMDTDIPVRTVVIEQGHFVNRPSKVIVEVKGDTDGIDQVKVSGTGIVVLRGTLYI
jgi:trans-2,3-dihydro-3-hydroxyanthranilate isomerase